MTYPKGEFRKIDKEAEEHFFEEITNIAKEKLESMKLSVSSLARELNELKEVYDPDEKEGLAQWFNTDARFEEVKKDLLRAQRAMNKPYFGRIDFVDEEEQKKETYYIGKAVIAKDPSKPFVIDWRAPVASAYYEQQLGICRYRVKGAGSHAVDIKRKRTYEIDGNRLVNYYDTQAVANDDLLTQYLSQSKKNVLSEIIATIQKEQNDVIRRNPHHNMLIQGSAGSGKTTVAMHRISYILYNYESEFAPRDFYIVGGNAVLLNYITGVLPDLDVYDVKQYTMEELFTRLLYEEWDSQSMKVRLCDKTDITIGIKGNSEWYNRLESYASKILRDFFDEPDVIIEESGRTIMTAKQICRVLDETMNKPIAQVMERMDDVFTGLLENELYGKYLSYPVELQKKIFKRYKNYFGKRRLKESVFDIYDAFIKEQFKYNPQIPYEYRKPDLYDLASLAYLYKRLKETEVIREACHVVIDEAQDFGIGIYRSLKYCLSKCTFTIMGDVSQNINFGCGLGDWEELKKLMLPDRYDYFGLLKKSYRNTIEISNFATDILRHGTFPIYPCEPIIRHGNAVDICKSLGMSDLSDKIRAALSSFNNKGYDTVAVICKDVNEADAIRNALAMEPTEYKLLKPGDDFVRGVLVLPIELSKGLEFDAVIVADASKNNYPLDDNYVKLLYVAATRALHELKIFYTAELTEIITGPISEDRQNVFYDKDEYHIDPYELEEDERTDEQIAEDIATEGDDELKLREKFGPKRITIKPDTKETESKKKVCISPGINRTLINKVKTSGQKPDLSEFASMPDGTSIHPPGHGKINNSVLFTNADKSGVSVTGGYGILKIIPVRDDTLCILFSRNNPEDPVKLPNEIVKTGVKWKVRQSKDSIVVEAGKITAEVFKRTGSVLFKNSKGEILLEESDTLSRQFDENSKSWWNYFKISNKELFKARGDNENWTDIDRSAKYVSNGPDSDLSTLLMSMKGYQLIIPPKKRILFSKITTYEPFIKYENERQIEYYVRTK